MADLAQRVIRCACIEGKPVDMHTSSKAALLEMEYRAALTHVDETSQVDINRSRYVDGGNSDLAIGVIGSRGLLGTRAGASRVSEKASWGDASVPPLRGAAPQEPGALSLPGGERNTGPVGPACLLRTRFHVASLFFLVLNNAVVLGLAGRLEAEKEVKSLEAELDEVQKSDPYRLFGPGQRTKVRHPLATLRC